MNEITRPRREPGAWLDSTWEDVTKAGCKVCGWYEVGLYAEVRQQWLDHEHDPILDIEERLWSNYADATTLYTDIEYLLWRLEEAEKNDR